MSVTPDLIERAFRRQWVDGVTVAATARELGTSGANVCRWSKRFMKEHPARAVELMRASGRPMPPWLAGADVPPPAPPATPEAPASAFLQRVRAGVESVPPPTAPVPPPSGEAPADEPDISTVDGMLAWFKKQALAVQRHADRAEQLKDQQSLRHLTRTLQQMLPTLAALEKARGDAGDRVSFSASEIADACESVLAKYAAIPSDRCAHCGRTMRIEQSGADAAEIDEIGDDE